MILTGRAAFELTQWNIASGQSKRHLDRGTSTMMAFSADRKTLATIDQAGVLSIWDVRSAAKVEAFKTGISKCTALAFSPDGRTIAFNGGATALHYWDRDRRLDRLAQSDTHSHVVDAMLVTADGKALITSSHENPCVCGISQAGARRRTLEHPGEVHTIATFSRRPNADHRCRHPQPGLSLGPRKAERAGHLCRRLFFAHTFIPHRVLSSATG